MRVDNGQPQPGSPYCPIEVWHGLACHSPPGQLWAYKLAVDNGMGNALATGFPMHQSWRSTLHGHRLRFSAQ